MALLAFGESLASPETFCSLLLPIPTIRKSIKMPIKDRFRKIAELPSNIDRNVRLTIAIAVSALILALAAFLSVTARVRV